MKAGRGAPQLSAFDVGCVVVGGIVGVGIFFTPSVVAARTGSAGGVLLAWALGGVVALLGALVFAELGARVPGHGGTFLYVHRAFGSLPAFLYGWANWLVIQAGAMGVIGLVLADHLDVVLFGGGRLGEGARVGLAAAAILAFTSVNVFGLRTGKGVQNVLTVTKVAALAALVALAVLARGNGPAPAPPADGPSPGFFSALSGAMLPVLFSFGGWQQGSFLAGAARRPTRDVPLGIFGGVLVVVVAYLAVNVAYLDLLGLPGTASSSAVAADAARAALAPFGWGEVASRLLAGAVVVSALGILNTCCLAPPFVLAAMAEKGLFPRRAGAISPATGTPALAVLAQGCWSVVLLAAVYGLSGRATLALLLDGVVFVDWIFYGLAGAALLRLRLTEPDAPGRLPLGGGAAALFALSALAVTLGAVSSNRAASLVGLGVCALGVLVWLARRRALRRGAGTNP